MLSEMLLSKEMKSLRKFDADVVWFHKNYNELKREYKGEYIAVKDKKVIGHNKNPFTLMSSLREEHSDLGSVVIEYLSEKKIEYIL